MKNNAGKFDPELYRGTYEYYAKYRPSIPKEVIDIIIKHFNIKPSDRVLDIGCGTGQVALALNERCKEMVCLDPDPEMIKLAKKATKNSQTKLTWINSPAEDLGKLKQEIGIFKVATISRAFHRMNQDQVLKSLNKLIDENGGMVTFSDRVLWSGERAWQQALKAIIQKYLKKEGYAEKGKLRASGELWENILARSVFRFIKTHNVPVTRNWNIESIIGYVFSTAFAAPHLFGNQLHKFEQELKDTLLKLNPKGTFRENASWAIILGSKKRFRAY